MKKNLEEMLNNCSIDAIIAVDTHKNIIAWNATAEKIHGKTKASVIGKCITQVIPSIQEDAETLNAINLAGKGIKSFVPASKKYFHRLHAENHFIPLKNENELKGVMNLVHDVAHRIKAENQLQELNEELERRYRQLKITSEELASFTYITSSKIKEPIRQVYTGIEHLIKTEAGRLTDSGKASFRRVQSSISRMDLLLADILSLAQISILEKPQTVINVNEIISEVTNALKNKIFEKKVTVSTDNVYNITAHKSQVYLLLFHLIDNAIKFNESASPRVNITGERVTLNEDSKGNIPGGNYYKLAVADNGIGFNPDDFERMFKMFEKLHDKHYKGSGKGLAIARKIMEAHNGFITAKSNDTEGSLFECFFPVED